VKLLFVLNNEKKRRKKEKIKIGERKGLGKRK
jgi:hypothetical protein